MLLKSGLPVPDAAPPRFPGAPRPTTGCRLTSPRRRAPQVRKLSVKRISSPIIFDSQNNPVPSGLYDPALGPLESLGTCSERPGLARPPSACLPPARSCSRSNIMIATITRGCWPRKAAAAHGCRAATSPTLRARSHVQPGLHAVPGSLRPHRAARPRCEELSRTQGPALFPWAAWLAHAKHFVSIGPI